MPLPVCKPAWGVLHEHNVSLCAHMPRNFSTFVTAVIQPLQGRHLFQSGSNLGKSEIKSCSQREYSRDVHYWAAIVLLRLFRRVLWLPNKDCAHRPTFLSSYAAEKRTVNANIWRFPNLPGRTCPIRTFNITFSQECSC